MSLPRVITSNYAVSPALDADGFARAADDGYKTVISFLPDGEVAGQLTGAETAMAAERLGLSFLHIPVAKHDVLTDAAVSAARDALCTAQAPVLALCASGQRAAIIWAAAAARQQPVDDVLKALSRAGLDFSFLRDDLEAQAHRQHWMPASDRAAA